MFPFYPFPPVIVTMLLHNYAPVLGIKVFDGVSMSYDQRLPPVEATLVYLSQRIAAGI